MVSGKVIVLRSNPVNPYPAVERLVQTLSGFGYEVKVIGWDRASEQKEHHGFIEVQTGDVPIVRFGIPAKFNGGLRENLLPMLRFQLRMAKWLFRNRRQYDVIHAFDLDTGLIGCIAAKLLGKRLVYQIQDFYAATRFRQGSASYDMVKKMEFFVINRADAVTICTEARKHQIEGSHPKLLKVIHNATNRTDLSLAREPVVKGSDRIKIAYVGVLLSNRLLRELLTCVADDPRFELHIAGYGPLKDTVGEYCSECDRIFYYGTLPHDQALFLEQQCDIMTALYRTGVANHQYCAPNKLYESMLLGKPIMMCRSTGWDDLLSENEIGVLVESNEQGIRDGLEVLLNNRDRWAEMSTRSRDLFNRQYAWPIMEERILDIYRSI